MSQPPIRSYAWIEVDVTPTWWKRGQGGIDGPGHIARLVERALVPKNPWNHDFPLKEVCVVNDRIIVRLGVSVVDLEFASRIQAAEEYIQDSFENALPLGEPKIEEKADGT